MTIVISTGFHGDASVRLRVPELPHTCSPRQTKRAHNAMCGIKECRCGGPYRAKYVYVSGDMRDHVLLGTDWDEDGRPLLRLAREERDLPDW